MSNKPTVNKKPYCKVCFDAGKPESEYTSHWVRTLPDRSGKTTVTCPTLLNTECRYCNQTGHTTKFCKVLEKQNKNFEKAEKKPKKVVEPVKHKPTNLFASLCEDSDSDDENKEDENKDNEDKIFWEPLNNNPIQIKEVKTGWAAIVAKPAEVKKVVVPVTRTGLILASELEEKKVEKVEKKIAPWVTKPVATKKSWADESDSEDYEDDFEDDFDTNSLEVEVEVDSTW